MKNILALDLGTKMGYAYPSDGEVWSGTINRTPKPLTKKRGKEHPGKRFCTFQEWLDDNVNKDDIVYYEHVAARQPNVRADQVYGGWLAILQSFCFDFSVPLVGVHPSTIKVHATGKKGASKAEMIQSAIDRGHDPVDDNEADAIALLYYAMEKESTDE